MKNLKRWNNKAQATTELAIFASLFFVALGVLLNIGQNINHQIDVEVDAYLLSLDQARDNADGPVTYTVMRDEYLGTTSERLKDNSRSTFQGSATVLWGKFLGEPEIKSHVFYKINDDIIDMRQKDYKRKFKVKNKDGQEEEQDYYPTVWDIKTTVNTDLDSKEKVNENPALRIESGTITLKDTIKREMKTRYYDRKQNIDEDGPLITREQGAYPKNISPGKDQIGFIDVTKGGTGIKWDVTRTTAK